MTTPAITATTPTYQLVIEPGLAEKHYWRDLWRYRELFYVLAWRDVSVRYKQTIIGLVWALLQPFFTMVVFTVVFGKLAQMPTVGDAPYALLVYAGLLPWQFFASALSSASNSLIGNANLISKVYFPRLIVPTAAVVTSFIDFLISKVYFPRLIVPTAAVVTSFIDFLISFGVLVVLMLWYQFWPGWHGWLRLSFQPSFLKDYDASCRGWPPGTALPAAKSKTLWTFCPSRQRFLNQRWTKPVRYSTRTKCRCWLP